MLGAIIGDIVGSRFEFNNIKSKEFELFTNESCYTDDTVMTLAVADVLQNGNVYDSDKIIDTFKKWGKTYPNAGYGGMFYKWLFSDTRQFNKSYGNGAAMRISAVGWYAKNEEEVKNFSKAVTEVTHGHKEGLKGAEVTAMCIYYARIGKSKEFIKEYVSQYYDLNFDYDDLVKNYYHGEEICQVTVPQAIYCFLISKDFEDCLRTTISIGGDCDTTAAISCAIAEAYYRHISPSIVEQALKLLPHNRKECYPRIIIDHYFSDRSVNPPISNASSLSYAIKYNSFNEIELNTVSGFNGLQCALDYLFLENLGPYLLGNDINDLAQELLDEGNFMGFIETMIDCGREGLDDIRIIYMLSQYINDFNEAKDLIKRLNIALKEFDLEIILFDNEKKVELFKTEAKRKNIKLEEYYYMVD